MHRTNIPKIAKAGFKIVVVLTFLLLLPRAFSLLHAVPRFKSTENVESYEIAIILAAEVHPNGTPSSILRDRVLTGIKLFNQGKVDKLVMSGKAPEPEIMRNFAVEQGVPPEAIILDNFGWRTYDTCYRAVNVFGLKEMIVVTQLYHLPRTLLLCDELGIDVIGVPATHTVYWPHQTLWWQTRETLATVLAFSDLYLSPPQVSNLPYGE